MAVVEQRTNLSNTFTIQQSAAPVHAVEKHGEKRKCSLTDRARVVICAYDYNNRRARPGPPVRLSPQRKTMSPRPRKIRHCEGRFCGNAFKPTGTPLRDLEQVELFRDELEVLRLCDLDGLFQEQAGERMGISRGTVQRILTTARRKVAGALTSGQALVFVDKGLGKK